MSWASSLLTSSRALTSISRNVALGWEAFHAVMSRRICSTFLFEAVLVLHGFSAFPFGLAQRGGLHSSFLSCVCLASPAKPSPFYLFFPSLPTPMQKHDGHPYQMSTLPISCEMRYNPFITSWQCRMGQETTTTVGVSSEGQKGVVLNYASTRQSGNL